jgi:dihydroorotate dehydrogenase
MPDWTYHTLIRPVFMAAGPAFARASAQRFLRVLSVVPGGAWVVDFFGHSRADLRLRSRPAGLLLASPTGISDWMASDGSGLAALDRLGCGLIELGPITELPSASGVSCWTEEEDGVRSTGTEAGVAVDRLLANLVVTRPRYCRRFVRLDVSLPTSRIGSVVEKIAGHVDGLVLDLEPGPEAGFRLAAFSGGLRGRFTGLVAVIGVQADLPLDELQGLWALAASHAITGIEVRAESRAESEGAAVRGWSQMAKVLNGVRLLSGSSLPPDLILAGGAHSPADAKELMDAGAQIAMLDTGLLCSGPGLPKRINEALLSLFPRHAESGSDLPLSRSAGFWAALMGCGLLIGAVIALVVASTRVVLPYDEVFCGMSGPQLSSLNEKLLPFMAHDRVTLAGVMISCSILYLGLTFGGMARGAHWAKTTVVASALAGFCSFFLFLGFGYFDPFHAFVSAVLFQFLVMTLYARLPGRARADGADWWESSSWRLGQWGQLLMVAIGAGLVGAGLFIAAIGIGDVFVREDLEFLRTSRQALVAANDRLVPLVAHDRASLGGMLIATGLGVWLSAQWGIGPGRRWLWWTYLLAGPPAFVAAIGVHFAVGYINPVHLAPAFAGLVVYLAAMGLLRPWLFQSLTPPSSRGNPLR